MTEPTAADEHRDTSERERSRTAICRLRRDVHDGTTESANLRYSLLLDLLKRGSPTPRPHTSPPTNRTPGPRPQT